jgi:hypothetical protein
MLSGVVVLSVWVLGFVLLLLVPVHKRWKDDGDCREVVWHTLRIPTNLERFTLWRSRIYIEEDVK